MWLIIRAGIKAMLVKEATDNKYCYTTGVKKSDVISARLIQGWANSIY